MMIIKIITKLVNVFGFFFVIFLGHTCFSQPLYNQPKRLNVEKGCFEIGATGYSSNTYAINASFISEYFRNGSLAWKVGFTQNFSELNYINSETQEQAWYPYPEIKIGFIWVPSFLAFHRNRQYFSTPRKRQILENGTYLKPIYGEHIRLYFDAGIMISLGDTSFLTNRTFNVGGYANLGIEFTFNDVENTNGSYFIEIGGAYSGMTMKKEISPSIVSSGFVINTGFRFYLTR